MSFADKLARADAEESYRTLETLLGQHLSRQAAAAARAGNKRERIVQDPSLF